MSKQKQTFTFLRQPRLRLTQRVSDLIYVVKMSTPTVQNLEEAAMIASEFISSKFVVASII